jgi:hypothetical protein
VEDDGVAGDEALKELVDVGVVENGDLVMANLLVEETACVDGCCVWWFELSCVVLLEEDDGMPRYLCH